MIPESSDIRFVGPKISINLNLAPKLAVYVYQKLNIFYSGFIYMNNMCDSIQSVRMVGLGSTLP